MGKKSKKAMKAWRKEWITWGTENADYVINQALLQAFQDSYAEEKAKAEAALAAAFIHTPDPEHPVQFVGPRSLEKAVVGPRELHMASCDMMQAMMASRRETLVEPTKKYFCVKETAPWGDGENVAEFEKMADGGFHVAVANRHGEEFADINMTPEQFAAFKQWVMEN